MRRARLWVIASQTPTGLSYPVGVAIDSVTVRSSEFWLMYIGGLTHAARNVQTQVKSTVLGVTFDSVTVRSHEFWSMYIRGLTHATCNVQTQVKSTVIIIIIIMIVHY